MIGEAVQTARSDTHITISLINQGRPQDLTIQSFNKIFIVLDQIYGWRLNAAAIY